MKSSNLRWKPFLIVTSLACVIVGFASTSSAEGRGRGRGRRIDKTEVAATIRRAENASDVFQRRMDERLDRSRLDGTRREDNINEQVRELENALDRLRSRFDRTDTWMETRTEVQDVLTEARDVNRIMENPRFRRGLDREWAELRRDLNSLASLYRLAPLGR